MNPIISYNFNVHSVLWGPAGSSGFCVDRQALNGRHEHTANGLQQLREGRVLREDRQQQAPWHPVHQNGWHPAEENGMQPHENGWHPLENGWAPAATYVGEDVHGNPNAPKKRYWRTHEQVMCVFAERSSMTPAI